jgi:hypothetical protein
MRAEFNTPWHIAAYEMLPKEFNVEVLTPPEEIETSEEIEIEYEDYRGEFRCATVPKFVLDFGEP